MKKPKVRTIVLVVATLALWASAIAQPGSGERQKQFQSRVIENFRASLTSDIQGVVEWTILDVVVYKKYFPTLDYNGIVDRLNRLAATSKIPLVSYKAYLASMYLSHGDKIDIVPSKEPEQEAGVFKQIAEQLEKNLLTSNIPAGTMSSR